MTLLYRSTRGGFGSNDFHSKCDGHSNTFTIFKAAESSNIFGGFTTVDWNGTSEGKSDPNAFIFSLTNKDNQSLKMKIDPNQHGEAIYFDSDNGPTFGCDICIPSNPKTTMDSFSILGHAYSHPQYSFGTDEAQTFLAGSHQFQLDEIEVFQKKE